MTQRESAENLALEALGWLVGNDDLLPVFLGSTGLGETDLRTRADDPDLLAAVLDFLMMDDTWLVAFCDACGVPYHRPIEARRALPGGDQVHWT
jgi:hypothetical protein